MRRLLLFLGAFLISALMLQAQTIVSGTVTDSESGEVVEGVAVLVKGTTVGMFTDAKGKYSLQVPAGGEVLVFTFVGKAKQEIAISGRSAIDVALYPEDLLLDEVVVTALGIAKDEKAVTYAVQEVEGSEIRKSTETNLVSALSGKVAGLQVTSSTGTAGASAFFLLRGANTINGNNQPLIVVDGVPIDNQQLRSGSAVASVAYSNRAIDINQSEIENVTVLKGAAATALYGSQAGNGAILITTKRGSRGAERFTVEYTGTVTRSEISQVPDLQEEYSQGTGGQLRLPSKAAGSAQSGSWGARLDTLRFAGPGLVLTANQDRNGDGIYDWDQNGVLVGQSNPNASSRPAIAYDRYKFFQTALSTNHNLAMSASTRTSAIRVALGFLNETGVVPNNKFQRVNINVNAETRLWEKFSVSTGIQYISSGGTRIEQGSNVSGVMLGLVRTPNTFDNSNGYDDPSNPAIYSFPDGTQRGYRGLNGSNVSAYDNPYWTAYNNPLTDDVNRVVGNVTLKYSPFEWLNFTYRPGIDVYSDTRKQYFAIGSATVSTGRVLHDLYNVNRFNADLIANARRDLTEWLGLSLTLGHHMRSFSNLNIYTQGDGLVVPGFYNMANAGSVLTTETLQRSRNMAVFGSLDLELFDYLFLNATLRREAETTLPAENNTFNYYSVGGSFIFSELAPLKNNAILSFGKLRGSYGLVGLGSAFLYATSTNYGSATVTDGWTDGIIFPYNGQASFTLGDVLGNPNLKPEFRGSFELGLDLRFFKNRLGLDIAYYRSQSTEIILSVPIDPASGYSNFIQNAAQMTNQGIEAVFNATPVQTKSFSWDLNVNFTRNRNNVDKLADGVDQVFLGGFTGASTRAVVDYAYGTIFGFGFYKDAEGNRVIDQDGFPLLDPNEKAFASALPDYQIGIRNTFNFKGVSLSALLDIKQGGFIWNGTRSALYFFGTHQETADLRGTTTVFEGTVAEYDSEGNPVLYDHDNDASTPDLPRVTGANTQEVTLDQNWLQLGNANGFFGNNTEDFVEDASWVRLRDVSLGYTFPADFLGKKISNLSITATGRNLFLSTPYKGVDPETNLYGASNAQGLDYFNMPNTKSYTVSVSVSF
ncbi:MAG: SusC/RagA family TonB-linked outer membrane protein [Bacteroidetes bacterium]|nr:MAG: SusC/RagA family TonB-linked outer membrane protein [Bacteroidota bacterium]